METIDLLVERPQGVCLLLRLTGSSHEPLDAAAEVREGVPDLVGQGRRQLGEGRHARFVAQALFLPEALAEISRDLDQTHHAPLFV